jgi:hypothetical protein
MTRRSAANPDGIHGLNPMVTVIANALRVGSWIVVQSKSGDGLDKEVMAGLAILA